MAIVNNKPKCPIATAMDIALIFGSRRTTHAIVSTTRSIEMTETARRIAFVKSMIGFGETVITEEGN